MVLSAAAGNVSFAEEGSGGDGGNGTADGTVSGWELGR